MTLRKFKGTFAVVRSTVSPASPPYHSEISDDYLAGLQRQVDAGKPANFTLTPLSEAGW